MDLNGGYSSSLGLGLEASGPVGIISPIFFFFKKKPKKFTNVIVVFSG